MDITTKRLRFFESFLNRYNLSNDGLNLNIWCPFCKHPSKAKLKLSIHLEKGFYHCWVCDKKGTNVGYIISLLNKSKVAECNTLFKSGKKKFDLFEIEEIEEEKEVFLPDGFMFLAESFNTRNPDVRDVLKYAIKRGTSKHKLWMLRLGACNNKDFKRYLFLPSYDNEGKLNYFTARNIDADTFSSFKYKNADVPKKNMIFNELNIDWDTPITIVEGPLDLLKTNDNATCLLGSSLTEDMLLFQKIVKNKTIVNLALDSDVYYKTLKIAKLLSQYDIDVNILDTRGDEDVGDMSKERFTSILKDQKSFNENDALLAKIRAL
jgi:DNA primase